MGLQIMNNVAAFNSYRNLSVTSDSMSKSLEKLSSGFRINRAADDAAGLAISEGLRSQIGGLKVAVRNAQDGVSVVQTAEGALTEVHSMLQRMRDLTVQAANSGANGGNTGDAVKAVQAEIVSLSTAINDVATRTKFNGTSLLTGDVDSVTAGAQTDLTFQVGANSSESLTVTTADMRSSALGTGGTKINAIDLTGFGPDGVSGGGDDVTATTSANALGAIDAAIKQVSTYRANLGAAQNRFEHTVNSLNVAVENLTASESRIRDTDMASEMTNFTKNQILSQAGTAMLAQANQVPQGVLQLLRG